MTTDRVKHKSKSDAERRYRRTIYRIQVLSWISAIDWELAELAALGEIPEWYAHLHVDLYRRFKNPERIQAINQRTEHLFRRTITKWRGPNEKR